MPDTEQQYDPWAVGSGLADDFDGYIVDAVYRTDAQYMDGTRLGLHLEFSTDDIDSPEASQAYWCGPGWEAKEKGAKAVREDGKNKPFNKQTAMGSLITACLELEGVAEVLRGRGDPREAATWIGLGFHWERKGFEFKGVKDEKTGEAVKSERLLPTAYLGVKGEAKAAPAAPKKAEAEAGGAVPEEPAGEVDGGDNGGKAETNGVMPPVLKAKLRALAKKADTHDAFVEAAFDQHGDELADNDDWSAQVVDEAVIYEPARA